MRSVILSSILTLLLSGCFKYVPVSGPYDQVQQGSEVRARFVEEESFELSDIVVRNIYGIDAEFVREDNSDVVLSAFWLDSSVRETGFPGNGWSVRVPANNIAAMEIKRVDWFRTSAAVLGISVLSYLSWQAVSGGPGGGDGPPDVGGPVY